MTTADSFFAQRKIRRQRIIAAWLCDYFLFGLFYRQILKSIHYKYLISRIGELGLRPEEDADQSSPFITTVGDYSFNVKIGWKWGFVISAEPKSSNVDWNRGEDELRFKPKLRVHLHQKKSDAHENDGEFTTKDPAFNAIFEDRRADVETSKILTVSPDLQAEFVRFYEKWMEKLSDFAVNETRFECTLNHIGIFYNRIPDVDFQDLLADLAELMSHFDQAMKKREFNRIKIHHEKIEKTEG